MTGKSPMSPVRRDAASTTQDKAALQATLQQLLVARFSCRGFLPTPVPRTTIEKILKMAQFTASWCNSQPWEALITERVGTERFREALYAHATANPPPTNDYFFPERYVGKFKDRQRECGWQLYESVGVTHGDRLASGRQVLENFRFFGAPHVAIITSERDLGVYGVLDCGGYVQNFLLAASSLGVATIAQAALAMHADFARAYFGIPEHRTVICGISFGFEDPSHRANAFRTGREAVSAVAQWFDE
jgi:nitroreductase